MEKSENRLEALSGGWKFLLILAFILLVLAILEAGARLAFDLTGAYLGDTRKKEEDTHLYSPYTGFFYRPFVEARPKLRTDRHGFLHNGDEQRDLGTKAADEFRVFIFGGSSVAGSYVASAQTTLAAMLEQRLSGLLEEAGIPLKVRVVNAGVGGYMSAQQVSLLQWYVLQYKPDFVIFLDGSNDAVYWPVPGEISARLDNNIHDYHARVFINYGDYFSWAGFLNHMHKILAEHSALVSGFSKLVKRLSPAAQPAGNLSGSAAEQPMGELVQRHVSRYRGNVLASIGLTQVHGIGLAYFLQPTLLPGQPGMSESEKTILEKNRQRKWAERFDYFQAKAEFFNQAESLFASLSDEFESPGTRIASLHHVFDDKSAEVTVYGDRVHYTDSGREILSDKMLEVMQAAVLRQAQKRSGHP